MGHSRHTDPGEKGSVIVEATLVFPLVILVMVAFCVLIRFFVVYETLQHGMYETTREMSAYYYLYASLGLEEFSSSITQEANAATEKLDMLAEPMNATISNMRSIASQLGSIKSDLGSMSAGDVRLNDTASIEAAVDTFRNHVDTLQEEGAALKDSLGDTRAALQLIRESPLEALTYLLKTSIGQVATWAENSVMNALARAFMGQHVPGGDVDSYARAYGILNLKNAMAWNNAASGDVEMVLTYLFRIRLFNGFDFQVIQKTTTKGWALGV